MSENYRAKRVLATAVRCCGAATFIEFSCCLLLYQWLVVSGSQVSIITICYHFTHYFVVSSKSSLGFYTSVSFSFLLVMDQVKYANTEIGGQNKRRSRLTQSCYSIVEFVYSFVASATETPDFQANCLNSLLQ